MVVAYLLSFYAIITVFGLVGFGLLATLGLKTSEAWMGGRIAGMIAVAYPAWWAGVFGFAQWQAIGAGLLVLAALPGLWSIVRRRSAWCALVAGELAFLLASVVVLSIRLPHPQILGAEKPMDLGILTAMLRTTAFPPPDMWLAGEALPYYYWGALVWTLPIKLSAVPVAYAYNLVVATLAGLTFSLVWALGKRLSGTQWGGALAAFFAVFAGTFDGWRQLVTTHDIAGIDLWRSSRQDVDAITEWPLFSFWLGDLHPHVLSIPIALLALLLALAAGRHGPRFPQVVVVAVLVGLTGAANPWALLPTAVGVVLLLVTGDGSWRWPWGRLGRRWLLGLPLGVGAVAAVSPFFLNYASPFQGLAFVRAHTELPDLLLYAGVFLIPVAGVTYTATRTWHPDAQYGRLIALSLFALGVLVAALSGKPALVLLGLLCVLLFVEITRKGPMAARPALALACLGTALFLVPEIVYVVDPYGDRLHRMNTVFKAYIQAWIFLSLAWPVLMARWLTHAGVRRTVTAALLAISLPHLLAAYGQLRGKPLGLDGLAWMSAGDRAAVRFLRSQTPGTSIVEAVGDPYSQYARISAASGVPSYLGWENHESVWRGPEARRELGKRRQIVDDIYTSGDPQMIRRRVREAQIDYVVLGELERKRYPSDALARLRETGRVQFQHGDTVLLRFSDDR